MTSPVSLRRSSLGTVRRYWAAHVGAPDLPDRPGVSVVTDDADVLVAVQIDDALFVRAPASIADWICEWDRARLFDVDALLATIGRPADVRGPAHLAYADAAPAGVDVAPVSTVEPDDRRLARFAASMPSAAWEESGLGGDLARRYATSSPGGLTAVAGYVVWGASLAHMCVACAPERRGRGLAKAAARAALGDAVTGGLVGQWRSAVSNPVSTALGERLGFVRLGMQMTIRFADRSRRPPPLIDLR